MASFDVYNLAKFPKLLDSPNTDELDLLEAFTEYGNQDIETLAHQFEGVVANSIECLEEWSSFRQFVWETAVICNTRMLCSDSAWTQIYPYLPRSAKWCLYKLLMLRASSFILIIISCEKVLELASLLLSIILPQT